MKRILTLLLFCILGLLIGFVIGNKNKLLSPRTKDVNVVYDTSKKIEIEKSDDIVVDTKFKDDKHLSINVSNMKNETIKIKFNVKNNSKNDKALVIIKSKCDKDICEIKFNPEKIEIDSNYSIPIETEIIIKDTSKIEKDKIELNITLEATPI